jgi:hypothetical protein
MKTLFWVKNIKARKTPKSKKLMKEFCRLNATKQLRLDSHKLYKSSKKSDILFIIKLAIRRIFSLAMRNIIGLEYLDLCPEIIHRSQFGSIMFPFLWDGVIEDSICFFKGILFITHDTYNIYFRCTRMLKFSSK